MSIVDHYFHGTQESMKILRVFGFDCGRFNSCIEQKIKCTCGRYVSNRKRMPSRLVSQSRKATISSVSWTSAGVDKDERATAFGTTAIMLVPRIRGCCVVRGKKQKKKTSTREQK